MTSAASALLAHAAHPGAPESIMFARLVGARLDVNDVLLLGLCRDDLAALIERHFPGAVARERLPVAMLWTPHAAFVRDLYALLMRHDATAAASPADAHCLATIIAAACLRPDHLWRDLGLSGREDVTRILERHYPELAARNVNAMRWKKYLAQEVALAHGRRVTCAPGCPGCEDYGYCYPGAAS
jgi:nitrogen fixation protein NifQ